MIKIITKIIQGKRNKIPTLTEIHTFIEEYVKAEKDKTITGNELQEIMFMIQTKQFDLYYAAKRFAAKLGYQTYEIIDTKTGKILKRDLYEI